MGTKFSPISILLLGLESAGKTEIGQVLCNEPRIDFTSTKGVRTYNVQSKGQQIKLTEIGGSDSVRGIWPHYFNDVRRQSITITINSIIFIIQTINLINVQVFQLLLLLLIVCRHSVLYLLLIVH